MFCMHLHKFSITRADRQLGRRQCKYQPAITEIERREFRHGFEERTIGFRVLAIEKKMRSGNHCGSILTSHKMNSLNNAVDVGIYWFANERAKIDSLPGAPWDVPAGCRYRNDCEFTGNNFENGRAAGETVLCFSSEQGGGDAGCREAAQHSEHSRRGAERIGIDRFRHRPDYCE